MAYVSKRKCCKNCKWFELLGIGIGKCNRNGVFTRPNMQVYCFVKKEGDE